MRQVFDSPPIDVNNLVSFLKLWHAHVSLRKERLV